MSILAGVNLSTCVHLAITRQTMKLPKVPVIPITSNKYFEQIKQMKKDQKDRKIGIIFFLLFLSYQVTDCQNPKRHGRHLQGKFIIPRIDCKKKHCQRHNGPKDWVLIRTKLQLPNLYQTVMNSVSQHQGQQLEPRQVLASLHARVTSIKSTKQQWVSQLFC